MSRHQLTSRIAYTIYVERGRVPGRHREDWSAAEAVVELCLAFAAEVVRVSEPPAPTADSLGLEERALALLVEAVDSMGRSSVSKQLGYKTTSTVGRCLRGDRPMGAKLAQKIVAKLAPSPAGVRLAA